MSKRQEYTLHFGADSRVIDIIPVAVTVTVTEVISIAWESTRLNLPLLLIWKFYYKM